VKGIMDIAMWLILASLVVLIVMNPKGFTSDVTAIGTFVTGESKVLTGSGYTGKGGG